MDNITHSLIGLIAGEVVAQSTATATRTPVTVSAPSLSPERRRTVFVAIGIIGGNLPDLDLLYSYRGRSGDKLAYLLGHRGYTHTILACVVMALLLYGAVLTWLRLQRAVPAGRDHVAIIGMALLGTGLHLAMDGLNSYGVHPFWPIDNHWVYGDSLFIVEPLYWAAAAALLFSLRTFTARTLLALALAGVVVVGLASGMIAWVALAALLLVMAAMLTIGWRAPVPVAAWAATLTSLLVTVAFMAAGRCAVRDADALVRADFPAAHILDAVLTPMPANPLCWNVLMLEVDGDRYLAHQAVLALAPRIVSAGNCERSGVAQPTRVVHELPMIHEPRSIRWRSFSMVPALLNSLAERHCEAAALLRFARAPFALASGTGWVMGDLRFDQRVTGGFAEISIAARATATECPATPPWIPPRQDLLGPGV